MIAVMSSDILSLLGDLSLRASFFEEGESVFRVGDAVRSVHFIRSGMIHLLRYQEGGAALVMQRAGSGAVLAEASLFSDLYHCDAIAMARSETWSVPRRTIQDRLAGDGAFAQAWARHLAREVQRARLQAELVALRTVAARLDAWLGWNGSLPRKGEWHTVASAIGVSPEALYREIAKRGRAWS